MNWKGIDHFNEDEFRPPGFDGPVPMEASFIMRLHALRLAVDKPMRIHRNGGYSVTGHAPDSLHYKGLAADLHIGNYDVLRQALLAYKWSSLSVGIYPFWHNPGLHLDQRLAIGKPNIVWFQGRDKAYHYYHYDEFGKCLRDLCRLMEKENAWKI